MTVSTVSSCAVSGTTGSGRACAAVMVSSRTQQAEQILDVHHAHDVIEILLVDRVARVGLIREELADGCRRHPDLDSDDPDAGHHHLRRVEVAELEQLLEHLARLGPQGAKLAALLDDQLQLLRRVVLLGVLRLAVHAKALQQQVAEPVQRDDEGDRAGSSSTASAA